MKCRISHLAKPAGYASYGIRSIRLLDYDDFVALQFNESDSGKAGLYNNNLVTTILSEGEFIDLEAAQTAKYSLSYEGGRYNHTLETFLDSMRHTVFSALDLAAKRRKYVVLFQTNAGRYFLFGDDPGAQLSYSSQTDDTEGSAIKITAVGEHPLFEVDSEAATQPLFRTAARYAPNINGAFCLSENGEASGLLQYCYMMKVSAKSGEPLDVNGCLCSVSGKPQAYQKLAGATNLSGNFFSEGTFSEKGTIGGTPTYVFDLSGCAIAIENSIQIAPESITVNAGNTEKISLSSKSRWISSISDPSVAKLNITSGSAGNYTIHITGVKTGACAVSFANAQTGESTILQVTCIPKIWILHTGAWNDKGVWIDTENWLN